MIVGYVDDHVMTRVNFNPIPWGGGAKMPGCTLLTDLPMICKFNFILYSGMGEKIALYVPWFNFGGPLKSEMSDFIKRII